MTHPVIAGLMMLAVAGFLLNSCDSGSNCETSEVRNADLQAQVDSLKVDHTTASQKIASLEADLQDIIENAGESTLKNPTWEELKRFIEVDQTDTLEYVPGKFDCEGFTVTLRDNSWRRGFRSAYMAIGLGENSAGHTLNAFQTANEGLVYIDNTQQDTVGYIETAKAYGTIAIAGVKEEYIACTTRFDEFWKPLTYAQYSGSIFDYAYYENYTKRDEFYSNSVSAYNSQVSDYNSAVNAFNQGNRTYSHSELEDWEGRLEAWSDNLDKLIDDLGSIRIEPLGTVDSIEIYWN